MSKANIPPHRIQAFFEIELPESGGVFTFKRRALACGPGSLVLFQYVGGIVASAVLDHTELGYVYDPDCGPCNGAYHFRPDSIKWLSRPILLDELRTVAPNVHVFGQASHTIPIEKWDEICGLLTCHE